MRPPRSKRARLALASVLCGLWGCDTVDVRVPPELLPPPHSPLMVIPGETRLDEVKALTSKLGLNCKDASPKVAYAAARKARGQQPGWDAKSGASPRWNDKSPSGRREPSPQVRWSCIEVPSRVLQSVRRPDYSGRWLFVFDDDSAPLRHVSYRRSHLDLALAHQDIRATASSWRIRFERPKRVSTLPPRGTPFPRMKPIRFEWNDGKRVAKLSVLSMTGQRADIVESIELADGLPTPPSPP